MKETLKRWGLVIIYSGFITGLSSVPSTNLPTLPNPVLGIPFLDKIIHITIYGMYGWILGRAIRRPWIPLLVVALYGAFDENYQRFTPGRSCDLYDWMADVTGGIIGLLILSFYERFIARHSTSS